MGIYCCAFIRCILSNQGQVVNSGGINYTINMQPVILIVLDGWGINSNIQGNAIASAETPFINMVEENYPFMSLKASGISVGLSWNETGNSESGHITIGTGRIVYQYLPRIIFAIQDGTFFQNPALLKAVKHIRNNKSNLHLMGLLSSGTVHSYIDHFYALLEFAQKEKISNVFIHAFTDGKDSSLYEAKIFLGNLIEKMKKLNKGRMVTVMGRDFAMNRDDDWKKTQEAYNSLVGLGAAKTSDIIQSIDDYYKNNYTDQDIPPTILYTSENTRIKEGDAVIFFNFREDSARQLTRVFVQDDFTKFARNKIKNLCFVTMTRYESNIPAEVMFEGPVLNHVFSEILSRNGKNQLKIAETEKYAHVTYFFNGLQEQTFPKESRIIVPSPPTSRYENFPEMKAGEIADIVIEALNQEKYDFILANFANADMVGHSGNFQSTIKAVEFVDKMLVRIYKTAVLEKNGVMMITGDHGNAEQMINPFTGAVETEHTTNPVPFYLIANNTRKEKSELRIQEIKQQEAMGLLSDIAPTILKIMRLEKPEEMTGRSLLEYLK